MALIQNSLKDRLARGGVAVGMGLRQARTADIGRVVATCGFDWAFIDMEHGTLDMDTAMQLAIACHDAGVVPLVRVPGYEHHLATRLLDGGVMGIVFPHVDTPEQAAKLVDNCKYPPQGHRSIGGPMAQLAFRAVPRGEATAAVNAETMLVMMLESPLAIASADAIAALPGVDALLIGTNDLTTEMGIPGQFSDGRVIRAYEAMIAACRRHGKIPAMGGIYDPPTMETYIKLGCRMVLGGSDLSFLMAAGEARVAAMRRIQL